MNNAGVKYIYIYIYIFEHISIVEHISKKYMKDITWWREDMNIIFEW